MRQTGFSFLQDYKKEFGGRPQMGRRKTLRPLTSKEPIHLILKSTKFNVFHPKQKIIHTLIRHESARFGIRLYDYSPNWSHIHLLIRIPNREAYKKFIRSLTALLVCHLSVSLKQNLKGLFDLCPYTKIISWGRQFKYALRYQTLNQAEATEGRAYREHIKTVLEYEKPPD